MADANAAYPHVSRPSCDHAGDQGVHHKCARAVLRHRPQPHTDHHHHGQSKLLQPALGKLTALNLAADIAEGWTREMMASTLYVLAVVLVMQDGSGNDVLEMEGDCAAFNDNCRRHLDEVGVWTS